MLTDTPLSVADVLDRAAETITEGWCQHSFRSNGCHCALGAIATACGIEPFQANFSTGSTGLAAGFLRAVIDSPAVDLWNDNPDRTQPEVVAALRRAAELARAGDA